MTVVSSLFEILVGYLSLLYGLGEAREGRGLIVIEAQGTVQQIFNGFLGKGKFVPIVAAFLTHKQSIPWYESAIKVGGFSQSDAHKHALEQVGNNEKLQTQQIKVTSLTVSNINLHQNPSRTLHSYSRFCHNNYRMANPWYMWRL